MSIKLKALGLGLLAAMAMSAVAVMNAGASTGGHFVSTEAHTNIEGFEGAEPNPHVLHFNKEGGAPGERIGCDVDKYTGTISSAAKTATEITITPSWEQCYTTGSPNTKFEIHENKCDFLFTISKTPLAHNTAHVKCQSAGEAFVITHPNCTITVPPQTVTGVTYTNITESRHEVTLTSTVKGITAHYHAGICIFLGTTHKSEMTGSVTVKGFNTEGVQIPVTATG